MPTRSLNQKTLQDNFQQQYLARGRLYFADDMVSDITIESKGTSHIAFRTRCSGSGGQTYEQFIRVIWRAKHAIIHGDCSCPVGFNCKHVAAACLQYQQWKESPRTATTSEPQCQQWLSQFIEAGQEQTTPSENNEFIHYLLNSTAYPGELKIELIQTRPLKNGKGFIKGKKVDIDDLQFRPNLLLPIDKEITSLLIACPTKSLYSPPTLTGKIGFLAIAHLLESGRCFWQSNHNPPLQALDERPLKLQWQQDKQGNARLACSLEGGGELLLTAPAIFHDAQLNGLGTVTECPFTPAQLAQLLKSVTVPAKQMDSFSQQLASYSDTPLQPPKKIKTLRVENCPPQPRIRLNGVVEEQRKLHRIDLDFLYQGYAVPAYPEKPIESLNQDGELIKVSRDLAQEAEYSGTLIDFGFQGFINEDDSPGLFFLSVGEEHYIDGVTRWQNFLEHEIPKLAQAGWIIETDESFQLKFHQAGEIWDVEVEEKNDWFELHFDIDIGGEKRPLLPLIASVLQHYDSNQLPEQLIIQTGPSDYLTLPSETLKPVIDTLYELYDSDTLSKEGSLRLSRFDAGRLDQLEQNTALQWNGGEQLRKLGRKLNDFTGIQAIKPPKALNAELREYQQQGLNWLQFLREYQFNGILADDMGLGKTVQTLAHLQYEKQSRRLKQPCLIIAPTSLVSNWRREAEKFTPRLKVLVLHGPDRQQHFDAITDHDVVITTYPLLARDGKTLLQHHFHYLVLDEAQVIKNPKAKAAQLVRQLHSNHRLCLTGTPMENHLGELWALFDFLMPGFLGDASQFKQLFRTPIEQHHDQDRQQRLSQRITPFMLRRTKSNVADELPEKTEIIRSVPLDSKQAALYESIRIAMERKVQQAINQKGLARSHITILDALLKLRQCCCDPQLLKLSQAKAVKHSAKLEMLMEMVPEMLEEGRRILLFSQFTGMLAIIESRLQQLGIRYSKLTGQTRKRDEAIQSFKDRETDIFLISLKAGGVGLNLTEADTVIHYDPWWNPAAENQATDRAHRIGQEKAVFVYKLITENTLEEKILAMQEKKQALADGIYNKEEGAQEENRFSGEELQALLAPLGT